MDILESKKVEHHFPEVIVFIKENDLLAEMEVRMKKSIWGVGSRQTIYNALAVRKWDDATPSERIILWEGYQMMKEYSATPIAA